jgi:hypothetical protein
MTIQQAQDLGYALMKASPFEVGLIKSGRGVRTWWAREFAGRMPKLDHSLVQEAIRLNETPISPPVRDNFSGHLARWLLTGTRKNIQLFSLWVLTPGCGVLS